MTKHEVGVEGRLSKPSWPGVTARFRWRCSCGGCGSWSDTAKTAESVGKAHADYHNNKRRK